MFSPFSVARLRRKPHHFHRFTGLTAEQFDRLLLELEPAYREAHLSRRRDRSDRQRAMGAGHPFSLALSERVLMGLIYLRLYVSQSLISYLFDLDESNVSREFNQRLLPVLLSALPTPLRDAPLRAQDDQDAADPEATAPGNKPGKRRRLRTLTELLESYPEMEEVLIDATEQKVPKPKDKEPRKIRYSGKKKEHTIKTQVLTTKTQILHVFGGLPGSLHDMTLLRASGVMHQVPADVKARLDCGYEGADAEYAHVLVQKPVRCRRGHKVTALGRAYNQMISRLRVPVEHVLSRLKKFHVLSDLYRGRWDQHEDLFCVVSGLVNYKATGQFRLV